MIKTSISLQDLRRKIYLKAKAESAGTDGIEPGFMKPWGCIMTTGLDITGLESAASWIGSINLWMKLTGKHNAGNPHVVFDEAGTGNVVMVENVNPTDNRKSPSGNPLPKACAPVLDPTCEGRRTIFYGRIL